jgi:hypothetical protein
MSTTNPAHRDAPQELRVFEVTDMTDDEVHEMAVALVEWQDEMSAQTSDNRVHAVSDDFGPLLDPFGGSDDYSGDIWPTDEMVEEAAFWDGLPDDDE